MEALDRKSAAALVMLDLSAAFDVIDHQILFQRLQYTFGVTSKALEWLQSYLHNRTQCVRLGDEFSSNRQLPCGVPQGSVLGPMIYCMFTRPVGEIIRRHNLHYHCYADDSQIYMMFKPTEDWESVANSIEACVSDVADWMGSNMLKLNQDKTELIVFTSKNHSDKVCDVSINVGGNTTYGSTSVRNLGVFLDSQLTMKTHVNQVTKSCYYQLRNIGTIRNYITDQVCKTLVQALVTSRMDYGNALLYDITDTLFNKLQHVQNQAARIVTRTRKWDHISPVLQDLHWLPARYRPTYKILLYTYKVFHAQAPLYLCNEIKMYVPGRPLRSQNQCLLAVPRAYTATYGDRIFSRAASKLWNSLPDDIQNAGSILSFKKLLKTHLFKEAFKL